MVDAVRAYSSDFLDAVAPLLEVEGGYVDNPEDPGGDTKFGISARYHSVSVLGDKNGRHAINGTGYSTARQIEQLSLNYNPHGAEVTTVGIARGGTDPENTGHREPVVSIFMHDQSVCLFRCLTLLPFRLLAPCFLRVR